eukprot:COSAG04_NODE_945_length_9228_cov_3.344726_10_plen_446_part_00
MRTMGALHSLHSPRTTAPERHRLALGARPASTGHANGEASFTSTASPAGAGRARSPVALSPPRDRVWDGTAHHSPHQERDAARYKLQISQSAAIAKSQVEELAASRAKTREPLFTSTRLAAEQRTAQAAQDALAPTDSFSEREKRGDLERQAVEFSALLSQPWSEVVSGAEPWPGAARQKARDSAISARLRRHSPGRDHRLALEEQRVQLSHRVRWGSASPGAVTMSSKSGEAAGPASGSFSAALELSPLPQTRRQPFGLRLGFSVPDPQGEPEEPRDLSPSMARPRSPPRTGREQTTEPSSVLTQPLVWPTLSPGCACRLLLLTVAIAPQAEALKAMEERLASSIDDAVSRGGSNTGAGGGVSSAEMVAAVEARMKAEQTAELVLTQKSELRSELRTLRQERTEEVEAAKQQVLSMEARLRWCAKPSPILPSGGAQPCVPEGIN